MSEEMMSDELRRRHEYEGPAHVYPEAIQRKGIKPGPWTITDHAVNDASVDLRKRSIIVPTVRRLSMCGHDHSDGIRRHELGHVAFTPARWQDRAKRAKLDRMLVNAVEDARVMRRLISAGIDMPPVRCPDRVADDFRHMMALEMPPQALITQFAAAHVAPAMAEAARAFVHDMINEDHPDADYWRKARNVMSRLTGLHSPVFKQTLDAAAALQRIIDEMTTGGRPGGLRSIEARHAGSAVRWAEMREDHPPLTKPARAMPQRRYTVRDEGTVPTGIHRYAVDGRIFRQNTRRQEPLTVLVDCSGSMSWNPADLKALLDAIPATQVALYAGNSDHGYLSIVAKDGKRASDAHIHPPHDYGGNDIDGPALDWLNAQPGRRLWVSDGGVNAYEAPSPTEVYRDAARKVRAGSVMRVDDAQTAIDVARGKTRFSPSRGPDVLGPHSYVLPADDPAVS